MVSERVMRSMKCARLRSLKNSSTAAWVGRCIYGVKTITDPEQIAYLIENMARIFTSQIQQDLKQDFPTFVYLCDFPTFVMFLQNPIQIRFVYSYNTNWSNVSHRNALNPPIHIFV